MSRKVQMRKMWREGHRRSPRISALDAKKAQPSRFTVAQRSCSNAASVTYLHFKNRQNKRRLLSTGAGPASRTRGKKKRKLRPLQDVASLVNAQEDPKSSDEQASRQASPEDLPINDDQPLVQIKDSQKHDNQVTNTGQLPAVRCALWMPEKRILELILDVLQRKDTHEIFAEPVDENEVEDYYEIIKEPMDFGTMRAKLHEGMYNTLEQFEHDVFLISRNAMHFNSSSTIYFRQARAIDELAKKVFHVLKTDPANFEFEFSGARRRTSRRPKCVTKSSAYNSSSKVVTNSRSKNGSLNVSRTTVLSSASTISKLKTAMQLIPGHSSIALTTHSDLRDDEVPFGGGDASEADRRSTYQSSLSMLNDNSILSPIYNNPKLLMHMNQQDIGYRESLMLFVKGLGPTAQMIAKRKLKGRSTEDANYLNVGSIPPGAPNWKSSVTSSFGQWIPTAVDTKSQNLINVYRIHCEDNKEKGCSGEKMGVVSHNNDGSTIGAIGQDAWSSNEMGAGGVSMSDNFPNVQIRTVSHSGITSREDVNLSVAGLNNEKKLAQLHLGKSMMDDKIQSSDSASKDIQPNVLEHRLNNNYSFSSSWTLETMADGKSGFDQTTDSMGNISSPYLSLRGYDQSAVAQGAAHELSSSTEADWTLKSSRPLTPATQFIFDLPFLKTRLEQMNSFGQDRFLQQSSGGHGPFLDRTGESYRINHPHSSLDSQLTNLALQL